MNSPWKISVSFKNQSNQVPVKPISVSSLNVPFWYIRGLCVNCARSMRENIIVSSNLTRTDRMRSNDRGSSPVMKLMEGIFHNGKGGCEQIINRLRLVSRPNVLFGLQLCDKSETSSTEELSSYIHSALVFMQNYLNKQT